MLVLARLVGERIIVGDNIVIEVVSARDGKVRLAFDAPKDIVIDREEVRAVRARVNAPEARP